MSKYTTYLLPKHYGLDLGDGVWDLDRDGVGALDEDGDVVGALDGDGVALGESEVAGGWW